MPGNLSKYLSIKAWASERGILKFRAKPNPDIPSNMKFDSNGKRVDL